MADGGLIRLFLCGDVMTGRGIDQVLPRPCDPVLYEDYVKDARDYVEIAEEVNGPIPRPADFAYIWGDSLAELSRFRPHVRLINLETAITAGGDPWPDKGIHYRMHPGNVSCLAAAGIDCCSLANNHVLDWGYAGLFETLDTLRSAGIKGAGAGRNLPNAASPAVIGIGGPGRVLIYCLGSGTSGIRREWGAAAGRPGVHLLEDLSVEAARDAGERMRDIRNPGDVVVASLHWGPNWGYEVTQEQVRFARRLIDTGGVDVIHGHSSHHVKGIEVYRERLILYGCGDFLTDYEGIRGHEDFRGNLGLMYLASLEPSSGRLVRLDLVPTRVRRFRVERAESDDAAWLRDVLNREGSRFGTRAARTREGRLVLEWS